MKLQRRARLAAAPRPSYFRNRSNGIKYQSKSTGVSAEKGGSTSETDTYSVFASFGANVGGQGSVGIAQFFATGIAAQRLGANPNVAQALAVQPADRETVAATQRSENNLERALSAEQKAAAATAAKEQIRTEDAQISLIVQSIAPNGQLNKERLKAKVDAVNIHQSIKDRISGSSNPDELKKQLNANHTAIKPVFEQLYTTNPQ